MLSFSYSSPVGVLTITEKDGAICRVSWGRDAEAGSRGASALLRAARDQLVEYFQGRRQVFDLPLQVDGSEFQRRVCEAMSAIPYGETRSYGEIAARLGCPAQAVGGACGKNPIPIIIPCHRVLGSGGRMVGFSGAGGVETKVQLLRLEGAAGLLI